MERNEDDTVKPLQPKRPTSPRAEGSTPPPRGVDSGARGSTPDARGSAETDAAFEQLRELLAPDERPLEAEEVSRVLPEAVHLRSKRDAKLNRALTPTIEEAIQASVRRDPQQIATAIYPALGPAIRKSITETLAGMIQSLNEALEHSVSPQGIRWRIEAWRTGRPFAEVVLLHTLVYRVEQIFWIERASGVLLQHLVAPSVRAQSGDLVSGMLSAIQKFIEDSFDVEQGDTLQSLRVGDLTVWVDGGSQTVLATVIRGNPPLSFRSKTTATLETLEIEHGAALAEFDGDTSSFEVSRHELAACLEEQKQVGATAKKGKMKYALALIAIVVLPFLLWGFFSWRESGRWSELLAALDREPGILVTESGSEDGSRSIAGLRDPLARDPAELAAAVGLDPDEIHWRWIDHAAKEFDETRIRAALELPPSVEISIVDGAVTGSGSATSDWIRAARDRALAAGALSVDLSGVAESDAHARTLARARNVLDPPASVDLQLRENTLVLAGRAPEAWIAEASILARAIDGVGAIDATGVEPADRAERILARVHTVLQPPPSVTLTLEGDVVVASGEAEDAWIERAPWLARSIEGVRSFRGERLRSTDRSSRVVREARLALRAPASVTLSFSGGVLFARGRAAHQWILESRRLAPFVARVESYDDGALIDIDAEEFAAIKAAIESVEIYFEANTIRLAEGSEAGIPAVAARIAEIVPAAERLALEFEIAVIGHLDNVDQRPVRSELSRARAAKVIDLLVETGVPRDRLNLLDAGARHAASADADASRRRRVSFEVSTRGATGDASRP